MNALKKISMLATTCCFVSCATSNSRNIILRDMVIGAVVGTLVGQTRQENRSAYSTMYAGVGAATAGVISALINIPDEYQLQKENEALKDKVLKFEKQLEPQLVQKGSSLFSSPLPKEVSSLVDPGEWKRYKLDQWVQDPNQPNTWYRQIEMFEIIPPASR